MRLLVVLVLVALVQGDKLTKPSTVTTSTVPTSTTALPKSDKEKRTLSSEAALHNLDFFPPIGAHTRYVTQEYHQLPATKTQQYLPIPASKAEQYAQYTNQKVQQQYIDVPEPKIPQYVQEQIPKVQQYVQAQDPKVQQYIQAQDPKVQQYIQAQDPKVQQYIQAQDPKVQQYVQAQDPKVQQYIQAQDPKVQQYIQAQQNHKAQQYVQEQDPKIQQYVQAREQQYVQAKEQQYVPKAQPVNYQPQDANKSTYTVQYVPAQHISHSVGVLPKYQQTAPAKESSKYQFVSKTQKQPTKSIAPVQNLILPQQPYVFPSILGYQDSFLNSPQYTSPAYNLFNTSPYQYVLPSHHHTPAPYNVQPLVMMYTLPGGHYLNTHSGQNALLAFLTGSGSLGKSAATAGGSTGLQTAAATISPVPYLFQGQQVAYLVPPVAPTPVSHLVPQVSQPATYSQQNAQQPAASAGSAQYRSNPPVQYQVKS